LVVVNGILHALQVSFFMLWEVLWPLALGFLLSAMVQTVVSKRAIAGALGKPDLKGFALACGFGAASSSCSYAAVALARTLFRRGASFVNAIVFEFASTNLVFELGLALLILLGWQFVAAEFTGGLIMIAIAALHFLGGEGNPFVSLPLWLACVLVAFALLLWGITVTNMLVVKQLLVSGMKK